MKSCIIFGGNCFLCRKYYHGEPSNHLLDYWYAYKSNKQHYSNSITNTTFNTECNDTDVETIVQPEHIEKTMIQEVTKYYDKKEKG